jgi:4-hydroxybenzoate polyprenyltransferase
VTGGASWALVVAIFATLVYDTISATNSSPQTTQINARVRAATLMKWVWIGLAQAAGFVLLGAWLEYAQGRAYWPPLLGGGLAAVLLLWQYIHAKNAGLAEGNAPGTEVPGGTG